MGSKTLFEIQTGRMGFSFERAYVWAYDEQDARILFHAKYPQKPIKGLLGLFNENRAPFVSALSDEGFVMEEHD